ncbi:TPA: hypothetical protein O8U13_004834, partial [Enterobacter asburiae]|nr:hypothetical protein [Enterobacter asburiae]
NLLDDIKKYHKDMENFLVDRGNFIKDIEMLRSENNELKKGLSNNGATSKVKSSVPRAGKATVNAIYLLIKAHYGMDKFVAKDLIKKFDSIARSHDIVYSFQLKTVESWCTEFKKMDAKQ